MSTNIVEVNAALTIFIAVTGTIGNALIIYVFVKLKSLRTVNNVFLFQLAITDLTKALIILPVKAYTQLNSAANLGAFCQISGFISCITFVLSALLLAAISVVRYFKIVSTKYFDTVFTTRNVVLYSVSMLGATCILAILPIIGVGEYVYSSYHGVCFTKWATENIVFRSLFYVYSIGVCYPVLIFCYTKIFIKLRKHNSSVRANMRPETGVPPMHQSEAGARCEINMKIVSVSELASKSGNERISNAGEAVTDPLKKQEVQCEDGGKIVCMKSPRLRKYQSKEKRSLRNEIRVTKVMFTVVIAYSLCWLPALAVNILQLSGAASVSDTLLYLVVTLLELKIFINPLIYGLWNHQFRKGLKAVFFEGSSLERMSNTQDQLDSKASRDKNI